MEHHICHTQRVMKSLEVQASSAGIDKEKGYNNHTAHSTSSRGHHIRNA